MRRQVVDIKIQRVITEDRAEILEDQNGNQTVPQSQSNMIAERLPRLSLT
jgi:hypothetical protein